MRILGNNHTISCNGEGCDAAVTVYGSVEVTVQDLVIHFGGININATTNITVQNVQVFDAGYFGFISNASSNVAILSSKFLNSEVLLHGKNLTFVGNTIINNSLTSLSFLDSANIHNNVMVNSQGLQVIADPLSNQLQQGYSVDISSNTIQNALDVGLYIQTLGSAIRLSDNKV